VHFRLTRRALADLGLPVHDLCQQSADRYMDQHKFVEHFVERRSQNPGGPEWTNLPRSRTSVANLHSGRYRGLTWHQVEEDIVWLLGVGWHEADSRDDAYAVLKGRDLTGDLLPNLQDFLDMEAALDEVLDYVTLVAQEVPALLERARQNQGVEIRETIAGRVSTGIIVEQVEMEHGPALEERTVYLSMPPIEGPCPLLPYPEWLNVILAAAFPPPADAEEFDWLPPREERSNEIVVRWTGPVESVPD
jgi:hypothetical protein